MPIEVVLDVDYGDPWPLLVACPSLSRWREKAEPQLEVTALALKQDIYGTAYDLDAGDAAELANAQGSVLLPQDLHDDRGAPARGFCGDLRAGFFAFVASAARRSRSGVRVTYSHERGDYLYEIARWTFGPHESLAIASYDGTSSPLWQASREHWNEAPAPVPLVQRPFEAALRSARKR